ncbi:MAG TPA: permease-like cell division protein FtsX [Candidatus Nitrosotalea sp.]|nr:permease-like cell division protein FtsX [Candidatus Nitrosotalea sp.]
MKIIRHLLFALKSAWQSFWRNSAVSMAAVISVTLILCLCGMTMVVGHSLGQVLQGYRQKVSVISISVSDNTPMTSVQEFTNQLRRRPDVSSVRFLTKQQELARFQSDPTNRLLLQELSGNPVAARIEVTVNNLAAIAQIDALARGWSGADRNAPTDYQGDFISNLLRLSAWLTVAGLALMSVLVLASIVIVMNTIRTAVYHRRQEIEVMKLVGATEWFVRGPFILEGLMTGLIAAGLALGLILFSYRPLVDGLQSQLFFLPLSYDPRFAGTLGQDLVWAGLLLGGVGSYIGVRRFVRV